MFMDASENIGTEIPETDFAAFAKAMGVESHIINSPDDLLSLDIAAICNRQGPTLLDVRIDRDEVPPISVRTSLIAQ